MATAEKPGPAPTEVWLLRLGTFPGLEQAGRKRMGPKAITVRKRWGRLIKIKTIVSG